MTIPSERYSSLANVPHHLMVLLRPGRLTKSETRRIVRAILRHYPSEHELKQMAQACPDLLRSK